MIAVAGLVMMEDFVFVFGFVDATTVIVVVDVVVGDVLVLFCGDLYILGLVFIFGVYIFCIDCIFNGVYLKYKEFMGLVCI